MTRELTVELEQVGPLGKKRQVQLLDNRELRIIEEQKRSSKEYSVDLLALDKRHRHKFYLSWPWLLAGLIILLLTWIAGSLIPQYAPDYATLLLILVVVTGGLLIAGCLYMFWIHSSRRQYFLSRHARIPLLELEFGKPSVKEFKHFIGYLEQRINALQEHFQLSSEQQLSGEMRMLRRLADKKVLGESDYQKAKSKLLKRFE